MKKFEQRVRWEFKLSVHGHGRDCREALIAAAERLLFAARDGDFQQTEFEAIEKYETVLIDETDVDDSQDEPEPNLDAAGPWDLPTLLSHERQNWLSLSDDEFDDEE